MTKRISRQDARKQETRRQIQEAARILIVEHGYERTTMRMLAEAAGVGLGTISLHFKDKQSLLLASFYDDIGELSRQAIAQASPDEPLREQLVSIIGCLYAYYETHTKYLQAVVREALFVKGEWRERLDVQIHENVVIVSEFFEAGKARGEVKPELDSTAAAAACWSLYISILTDGLNAETFDAELQIGKFSQLLDVMLGGVLV